MTPLTTARLELRPVSANDFEPIAALYADADVMRYITDGVPRTRDDSATRLEIMLAHWRNYGFGFFSLYRRDDGVFVGRCGLQHLGTASAIELGYTLARPFWGQGFATEAARACVDHAFGTIGLARIVAIARPANTASRHVMHKLGMRFVKNIEWDGGPVAWYELDRPAEPA